MKSNNTFTVEFELNSSEGKILSSVMFAYLDEDIDLFSTLLIGLGYKFKSYLYTKFKFEVYYKNRCKFIKMKVEG